MTADRSQRRRVDRGGRRQSSVGDREGRGGGGGRRSGVEVGELGAEGDREIGDDLAAQVDVTLDRRAAASTAVRAVRCDRAQVTVVVADHEPARRRANRQPEVRR